jgi:hypothetical protein
MSSKITLATMVKLPVVLLDIILDYSSDTSDHMELVLRQISIIQRMGQEPGMVDDYWGGPYQLGDWRRPMPFIGKTRTVYHYIRYIERYHDLICIDCDQPISLYEYVHDYPDTHPADRLVCDKCQLIKFGNTLKKIVWGHAIFISLLILKNLFDVN